MGTAIEGKFADTDIVRNLGISSRDEDIGMNAPEPKFGFYNLTSNPHLKEPLPIIRITNVPPKNMNTE